MLRISKLTDYGIVLLAHFADLGEAGNAVVGAAGNAVVRNAREMAEATSLPVPAVSKILKSLGAADILVSQRGAKGGYSLARDPGAIRVAEIIEALEGPIALMACSAGPGHCDVEASCRVRDPWQRINRAIQDTLERVTLAELVNPPAGPVVTSERVASPATRRQAN